MIEKKSAGNSVSVFGKQIPSWVFVASLVLVALFGFIGYNAYLDYQDEQKFARMEETVNILTSRIDESFVISKIQDTSYCYEPGRKLEKNPLYCVYSQKLTGDFEEPYILPDFIVSQEDLFSVREKNSKIVYLVDSSGVNCKYEQISLIQIELSCLSVATKYVYPSNN